MSKVIKYKGYEIHVEKMTGYVATVYTNEGEVVTDESPTLLETLSDSIDDAKDFIDALTTPREDLI